MRCGSLEPRVLGLWRRREAEALEPGGARRPPRPAHRSPQALLRGNLRKQFSGYDLLMLGVGITIGGGVWRLTGYAAASIAG